MVVGTPVNTNCAVTVTVDVTVRRPGLVVVTV
jgi:hypothetical protein